MREEQDTDLAVADLPENPRSLDALLSELSPNLAGVIGGAFRRMELAEEEIELAKTRDPARAARIHEAFKYLRPTETLQRKCDELYRAHCRELIERVAAGASDQELAQGTGAEVLATLADLSLAAPLERTAFLLYGRLFRELFPERAAEIEPLRGPADRWEDEQAHELEATFRRKLATDRAA